MIGQLSAELALDRSLCVPAVSLPPPPVPPPSSGRPMRRGRDDDAGEHAVHGLRRPTRPVGVDAVCISCTSPYPLSMFWRCAFMFSRVQFAPALSCDTLDLRVTSAPYPLHLMTTGSRMLFVWILRAIAILGWRMRRLGRCPSGLSRVVVAATSLAPWFRGWCIVSICHSLFPCSVARCVSQVSKQRTQVPHSLMPLGANHRSRPCLPARFAERAH